MDLDLVIEGLDLKLQVKKSDSYSLPSKISVYEIYPSNLL